MELDINTNGWGSIKKMCRKCGEEFETNYDPNHPKPDINFFPCTCGAEDFIEITHFSNNQEG